MSPATKTTIKNIFFDFDGVLTTDTNGSKTICTNLSLETGISYDRLYPCYRPFIPDLIIGKKTQKDIWNEYCSCVGKQIPITVLEYAFYNVPFDEEMMALVKKLHGKYKLGIITDNSITRFDAIVAHHELDKLFDAIIVSGKIGSRKNEKIIFEHALKELKAKAAESVFIDNTADNLVIAKELGFYTLYYDDEKKDVKKLTTELQNLGIK